VTDALYDVDEDRFVPTALTVGPWDPGSQHGGAPSALLARAIEGEPAPGPLQLGRLTVELLRPVPLRPLTVTTEVVRPGRKVQLVRAVLRDGDVEVAAAHGLRLRTADLPLPEGRWRDEPATPGPEGGRTAPFAGATSDEAGVSFHATANDVRFTRGGFDQEGPAFAWIRLLVPVVAGESVSPAVRVAAAADFGNGLSRVLPKEQWSFVNPDLTVHLLRLPIGEWIGLDAVTLPTGEGIAIAEAALHDRAGRVGRSVQSLLLDRHTG
jgi:hypothetical protein